MFNKCFNNLNSLKLEIKHEILFIFRVLSNKHNITALEWDLPGDKLVVADTAGNVQLWMFKDHVLSDWMLIGSTYFSGEHILGAAWFHNGKKVLQILTC